jgi:radical SAM superfamily enzyme YgiQ (UPF0313 family)
MLGTEIFLVKRPVKPNASLKASWIFPNSFEVGMSSLGYQLVWWLLEQDPDFLVSRGFSDCNEGTPKDSDIAGFTLSFELDFINILQILDNSKIALLSSQRTKDDPIVFGGGPVLSANPEPFCDFFDVILLGDAEITVPRFLEAVKQCQNLKSRQEKLVYLSKIEGLYVPQFYKYVLEHNSKNSPIAKIQTTIQEATEFPIRQTFKAPDDYIAHSLMLTPKSAFANMFLMEIVRSCPQECRFCLASYLTRPFRAANIDSLLETVELGVKHTRKVGLLGPSVTEHPQFETFSQELLKRYKGKIDISIASIRIDSVSPVILAMLHELGQKSVTLALESGSPRLRQIMKKNLSQEQIFETFSLISTSGLSAVKLYGMVGLPGEIDQDLQETVDLLKALKKSFPKLRITFGVSSFVPKAQTPFQWNGRDLDAGKKIEFLRKHLSKLGITVRPESHNWSDIQALLSRGDRRLTPLLMQIAQDKPGLGNWKKAFRDQKFNCPDLDFYAFRQIPLQECLPWSHLVPSNKIEMLRKHEEQATLDSQRLSIENRT